MDPTTFWILNAVAGAFLGEPIVRLLVNWKGYHPVEIISTVIATILFAATALSAGALDYICTGGAFCVNGVQTYNGDLFLTPILWTLALISVGLIPVGGILLLGESFKNRKRGYSIEVS